MGEDDEIKNIFEGNLISERLSGHASPRTSSAGGSGKKKRNEDDRLVEFTPPPAKRSTGHIHFEKS